MIDSNQAGGVGMNRRDAGHLRVVSKAPVTNQNQGISRDNLIALRNCDLQQNSTQKMLAQALGALNSTIASLFAFGPKKVQSMCKYYGHVVDKKSWQGGFPRCEDCGCQITNPDQLRKATSKRA